MRIKIGLLSVFHSFTSFIDTHYDAGIEAVGKFRLRSFFFMAQQPIARQALLIIEASHILVNPLNPELNPICYLLALLGAHHFLHVSRIRVKLLTFRLLMSYIYIWSTHS